MKFQFDIGEVEIPSDAVISFLKVFTNNAPDILKTILPLIGNLEVPICVDGTAPIKLESSVRGDFIELNLCQCLIRFAKADFNKLLTMLPPNLLITAVQHTLFQEVASE